MQVSLENTGTLGRKLTIRLPADGMNTQVRNRLRELSQTIRLKGFRPGKVPAQVIEQRFGAQVRSEALGEIIGSSFQEAVKNENLRVAAQPRIETQSRGEQGEVAYTATFEVVPEIGNIDVAGLAISRTVATVEDADVERMIDTLRMQRRSWPTVERAAQPTDLVVFEYSATGDGVRFPAEGMERVGTIIGSGALFPEFDGVLNGAAAGDSRKLDLEFPANFREASIAGRKCAVEINVVRVQEAKLPELNEEFAAQFGITEGGLEKFRSDVRANLERELGGALRMRLKVEVLEKLLAANSGFELPQTMVETEARALLMQARQQAEQAKLTPPTEIEAFIPNASQRIRAFLLMNEIARQNNIQIDQQRVSKELMTLASTYEDPQQVIQMYARDPELSNGLRNRVLEDQVIEWVAEHAAKTDLSMSFEQVIQSVRG